MEVTFDKKSIPLIIKAFGGLRGRNCYFCGTPLNKDNFSGLYKLPNGKLAFFDGNITCLFSLVDLKKQSQGGSE